MRGLVLLAVVALASGCAGETAEQGQEERIGDGAGAIDTENAMEYNALRPNGIAPSELASSGIAPSELAPNGLTYANLSQAAKDALADNGMPGILSRMFIEYAVGCAFNSDDSFAYTDNDDTTRYAQGSLGLAPDWKTRGLTVEEQQWVSACLAARTNYYGRHVLISLRGNHANLGMVSGESDGFKKREGAFWGDLFDASPALYACYDNANKQHSQGKGRVCATKDNSGNQCGLLVSVGRCDPAPAPDCTGGTTEGSYYSSCGGADRLITVYLEE